MSGTPAIAIAAVPVALMAVAGAVCYNLGKGVSEGCKEVYMMCKEGNYPVERMQMVHTPLSNFAGLTDILKSDGFDISASTFNIPHFENMDISVAANKLGENIFLINSDAGIALISDNLDLVHSTIQGFAINEIVTALRDNDFSVTVKERGSEKVITATDRQKNKINVSVGKGNTEVFLDTRRTRRPKCDIIHQTISAELKKYTKNKPATEQQKRKREDNNIRLKN
ncbi:MAG: hypothetical protein HY754_13215 [Nitrospirae bacterium]|nr:hypothetical protein [Nitrospirota bacterium]